MFKRPVPLLLVFLFFINRIDAQQPNWHFTGYGPHFRDFNAVQILNTGRIIAAGGNFYNDAITSFFVSDDSAASWGIEVDSINAEMNDMHFPADNAGYAVGNAGMFYKTIDQGTSWHQIALNAPLNSRSYYGVHFTNATTGVAVGGYDTTQTIMRTIDGGVNWTTIVDAPGQILRDVMFTDSLIGFAVGDSGTALKTHDGGISWSTLTVPASMNVRNFQSVYFIDSLIGFIAGGNPSSAHRTLLKTIDGGVTWNTVIDVVGPMANVVYFLSDSAGYIGGENGLLLYTADQGSTWTSFTVTGNDVNPINDINFLNASFGIASGVYGKTLIYRDTLIQPPSAVINTMPIIINANSVMIDGVVSGHNRPTTVEFEYGLTPSFGTTLAMTPSLTSNNNQHDSVLVTGLLLSNVYYGRIKVTNSLGFAYSGTIQFHTDSVTGPNFDFENWNDYSNEYPLNWFITGPVQKVLSYDGSFATRIIAQTTNAPGALYRANDTGHGPPFSGLPFSGGRPDTLMFYAKYDVVPNDSALAWFFLSSNGINIVDTIVKIPGSSGGLFQLFKIPIHYTSLNIPDSLGLLFASSDIFTGNISTVSEITIDNIQLHGSSTQLPNSDMESWGVSTRNHAVSWYSNDDSNFNPEDSAMVKRSTNAFSGNYALMLRTFANTNQQYNSASMKSGPNIYAPGPDFAVFARHTTLNGMYELNTSTNDTFTVMVSMYKLGVQVGGSYVNFTNHFSNYSLFTAPINYYTSDVPDSCAIQFFLGKRDTTQFAGNSWVLIDDLGFDGVLTSIDSSTIKSPVGEMNLFPNPAQDHVNIQLPDAFAKQTGEIKITVFDMSGKECLSKTETNRNQILLDVSGLNDQLYFIEIKNENQSLYSKLIISR